ncbi:hypothetical protein Poli38472_014142 [Pythium oligandrum]|uniref:Pantoate--beta-alanine ligase n=1 Tax=Pythium oligandrum TaxID=41045 RepID=A0A8K1CJX1_PYTOL|nr:hypothetical protein Poli38472_014142 [Pythium oligandrum]|eukprot:TMW64025.1 hypothetical protein Poli38472_014142 [Pythium oligandrum]
MMMATRLARRAPRAVRPHAALFSSSALQIIETVQEFHDARRQLPAGTSVGFVPTMGGLHAGHLSLVRAAKQKCDVVAASVFVNPTQFGPNEDYSKYPRTFERDAELLRQEGVDFIFVPSAEDMYSKNHRCYVVPEGFDDLPEGLCRPGHFRGVATVVTKLFNVVSPTHAFFGQKDAAQCVLIKRLVDDLNMDVQIEVVPVAREADGLAMSTRNQYLNTEERAAASVVYRGLTLAKEHFESKKTSSASVSSNALRAIIEGEYKNEPLVQEIQYISIGSKETMEEIHEVKATEGAIISVAVKLGKCRLIDTITL